MSARRDTWSGGNGGRRTSTGYGFPGSASAFRGGNPLWAVRSDQPRWQQRHEPQPRPPTPPLGQVLTTLSEKDLTTPPDSKTQFVGITDCEYVASYNWLNKKEPAILVPGKPPAWTPLETAVKLKEDNGSYFRDSNAARYPSHPIEPAVQALFAEQANFPTTSVDVFACGSTMGNLLRFVRKIDKPFRFLVEVVGNTVFFIRKENSPTELIPNVRGYGHTFPEAYTTWESDVKGSESNQRIIKYNFGGLACLLRFESDGYLVPSSELQKSNTSRKLAKSRGDTDPTSLSEAFDLTSFDKKPSSSGEALTVISGGQRVPQDSIFDLKTRSARKKDVDILAEEIARLWIAQIPNFIVAYHASGVFNDIHTRNVRSNIEIWEVENEHILRRLAILIRNIITIVKSRADGKLEVRRAELDILELRVQTGDNCSALPPLIKSRWVGRLDPEEAEASKLKETDPTPQSEVSSEHELDEGDPLVGCESHKPGRNLDSDEESEESEKDFTACSAHDCGYCGHCTY